MTTVDGGVYRAYWGTSSAVLDGILLPGFPGLGIGAPSKASHRLRDFLLEVPIAK